jgi:hypothetical protein
MDARETLGSGGSRKVAGSGANGSRAAAEVGIRNLAARLRSAMDCRPDEVLLGFVELGVT